MSSNLHFTHRIDARWVALALFFLLLDLRLMNVFKPGSDWAPLWIAGQMAWGDLDRLYDFELVARLQAAIAHKVDFHPYINPPSALLLIAPLALLPFWPSLVVLAAGSLALLGWASRQEASAHWLVLVAPPVVIAAIVGQTSLLVIALVLLALSRLERDERTAGILLAIAALIKPTLLVMVPIGLVAGRHWHAFAWAATTGLGTIGVTLLLFGIQPWQDWIHALPRFQQLFADYPPLVRNAISPYATAVRFGIDHPVIIAAGMVVASIFTWLAFTRRASPADRSAIIMGGALLLTPYAMNYELAVFAPALIALPRDQIRNILLIALWAFSLFVNAGVIGLLLAYLAVAIPLFTTRR